MYYASKSFPNSNMTMLLYCYYKIIHQIVTHSKRETRIFIGYQDKCLMQLHNSNFYTIDSIYTIPFKCM